MSESKVIVYCEECGRVLYEGDLIGRTKFKELTGYKCRYCGRALKEDFSIKKGKNPQKTLDKFNGES